MIRIRDHTEMWVRSLSVTTVRAQSTTGVQAQSDSLGSVREQNQAQSGSVIKGEDSVYDQDQGSVCG